MYITHRECLVEFVSSNALFGGEKNQHPDEGGCIYIRFRFYDLSSIAYLLG
jgi:hypothetical protein